MQNDKEKSGNLCILHSERLIEIENKLGQLASDDVVTVVNGKARELRVKEAVAEIWQRQYNFEEKLERIEARTEVLDDISAVVRLLKKYWKALLIVGVIGIVAWYGGLAGLAKLISTAIIKTLGV